MTPKFDDAGPSKFGWHSGDDSLFRCEQEFVFKHLREIQRAGLRETPRAKAIGLLFHAGRARWFRLGFPLPNDSVLLPTASGPQQVMAWDSIYQATQEEAEKQPLPMPQGAEQEALNILQQYVAHYSKLPKPKVLAAELEVGPIITFDDREDHALPGEGYCKACDHDPCLHWHTNRLDDISLYPDFANAEALGEAKTTSGKPSTVYAHYNANHGQLLKQMLVVTEAIKQGKLPVAAEPKFIVLDVVQKGYGGEKCKFERFLIHIEPYQLEWFARDLERVRQRRRELEANEKLGVDVDEGYEHARRNPTACRRLVSGDGGQYVAVDCEYLNLCKFGRSAATEYVVNGQPAGAVKGNWWR
jgi:hypothetical protein